ncbi:MAG: T9SS type A sorting domain-containing protein [Saprospiraceae bacterium]
MNKALLLLTLLFAALANQSAAQPCQRDSNLLITGSLLSPAPYTPDSPFYNLKTACINEVYNQSVTVNIPDSFNYQNVIKVKILSVALPPNAVKNQPVGITYSCDPPNCVFQPKTLGCILLEGTPTSQNMPDTFDLGITANVTTVLGTFPVVFPGEAAPGSHYYLILKDQGQCVSSSSNLDGALSSLRAIPNPTSGQTIIEANSTQSGTFLFEVFDLLGKRLHSQKVQLLDGPNQFPFDASGLPNGTYIYTVSSAEGTATRRMTKN